MNHTKAEKKKIEPNQQETADNEKQEEKTIDQLIQSEYEAKPEAKDDLKKDEFSAILDHHI